MSEQPAEELHVRRIQDADEDKVNQLALLAHDTALVDWLGKVFLTAGGEHLVKVHGFDAEQVKAFARATIDGASEQLENMPK